MYKDFNSFVPFVHENLDSKNQLIEFARKQDLKTAEGVLIATIIYVNLVDYIAKSLLDNLRKMASILTYKSSGAVFFYDPSEERIDKPLGDVMGKLSSYGFPDKESFLGELKDFNEARIGFVHKLMDLNLKSDATAFNSKFAIISKKAESILAKYNVIVVGIKANWDRVKPK